MPPPPTIDDYPAFFHALWGYEPFGSQTRLLARIREDGWPDTLDLPTGSGKTATLDVAPLALALALALDAFEPPEQRRQPRRVALVVDGRTVVDQAYDRAVRLSEALLQAEDGVVARAAGNAEQRRALGIAAVWRAELTKKADGYSGMFSPPEAV